MTRTGSMGNETTKLQTPSLKYAFWESKFAEGVSKQNSHAFKVMQKRQSCGFLYAYV